jgi:hypothetical protein
MILTHLGLDPQPPPRGLAGETGQGPLRQGSVDLDDAFLDQRLSALELLRLESSEFRRRVRHDLQTLILQ